MSRHGQHPYRTLRGYDGPVPVVFACLAFYLPVPPTEGTSTAAANVRPPSCEAVR